MQKKNPSDRIPRRIDDDGIEEGLELYRLLRKLHVDDLTAAFLVARSFSWSKTETAYWLLRLEIQEH